MYKCRYRREKYLHKDNTKARKPKLIKLKNKKKETVRRFLT